MKMYLEFNSLRNTCTHSNCLSKSVNPSELGKGMNVQTMFVLDLRSSGHFFFFSTPFPLKTACCEDMALFPRVVLLFFPTQFFVVVVKLNNCRTQEGLANTWLFNFHTFGQSE